MTPAPRVAASPGTASPPHLRRGAVPLAVGAAAVGGAVLLVARSPYVPLSYGICPSVLFLGVSCPGCGGLRATHDLLTGDLAAAWQANPLWTLAAPLLAFAWALWTVRRLRGRPGPVAPAWVPWTVLVAVVAFAVLRNVPALVPYLGPAPLP
ncbi:DUF2752 domain-containing protein [Cellulomonas xiejunii]|uniref:DUF2752 domain-containing protein n=1 Tax=Cellulomonas xiejunii TaxID=2968083 RepID=A0ABY5KKA1_9CELL|nr:DUF2752 domain-containing protein [Cellulomonas xiejunii]MCC2313148.1 DUF2752 domain-containing protein [Cellulomonas xiejunii]MCC2319849.1 DUF2752 domain-containing protein [Cellulomonas xiejunii]UUI70179.1 DUF2752 domain-containing protein [Cellulomonas xiejunii]